ncbi:HlyD family secretion protein [Zavarzinia compransoris]|nr:HlyD family efflux transporter periplasmic adaptor subunit [Zavarzinia compransoris]TDP46402.1 HlyD family secretion protein [Zavarzinia compransoris]
MNDHTRRNIAFGLVGLACLAGLPMLMRPPAVQAAPPPGAGRDHWTAAAPGIVEPGTGFIRISVAEPGRIASVNVQAGATVQAEDVLFRMADAEPRAHVRAAEAELALRLAERDGAIDRLAGDPVMAAKDALAAADRAVFSLREELDAVSGAAGRAGPRADLAAASAARHRAAEALGVAEAAAGPRPFNRKEAAVDVARAELARAWAALELTRIRAPVDGTVLAVSGQPGELALPSLEQPVVIMGAHGSMAVHAELDGRDAGKVHPGDDVSLHDETGAVAGHGTVSAVSPMIGRRTIGNGGNTRSVLADVQVVKILVDDGAQVLPGGRVDVYFMPPGADGPERSR